MNRARTNDRFSRKRNGNPESGKSGGYRSAAPSGNRSGAPRRSKSGGGRPAALQGEFALPKTVTPGLFTVESFAELDMPAKLLAALGHEGVSVPFPIQATTLPNSLV